MPILIVDDSAADREMTVRCFQECQSNHTIYSVESGEQALDFIFCREAFRERKDGVPYLIILDGKLLGMTSMQVLQEVRSRKETKAIPVVMLTGSSNPKEIELAYDHGANSVIHKPTSFEDYRDVIKHVCIYWLEYSVHPFKHPYR